MKEEPSEQNTTDITTTVKTEPEEVEDEGETVDLPMSMDGMLDVRIKEEATDEQSEFM